MIQARASASAAARTRRPGTNAARARATVLQACLPGCIAATLLVACVQPSPQRSDADGPAASGVPATSEPESVPAAMRRIRGELVVGKDGYGLTPCDRARQRMVLFSTPAQAFVDRFLAAGGTRAFFLDGWGMAGADGRIAIERIERLHTEGPRCDRAIGDAVFVARGNEPFWALRVLPDRVVLERPDADPVEAAARAIALDGGGYRWQADSPVITVTLRPGYCADGMADAASAWQARVTLSGVELAGCAHRGTRPLP